MGAASSQKEVDKAARARAIRAKIKAVAALTPNNPVYRDQLTDEEMILGDQDKTGMSDEEEELGTDQIPEVMYIDQGEELTDETVALKGFNEGMCSDSVNELIHMKEVVEEEEDEEEGEVEEIELDDVNKCIEKPSDCHLADDSALSEIKPCKEIGVSQGKKTEEKAEAVGKTPVVKCPKKDTSKDTTQSCEKQAKKSPNKLDKKEPVKTSSIRTKLRALASLTPSLPVIKRQNSKEGKNKRAEEKAPMERQESKREELLDFVKARKDARRENWAEYEKEAESPNKGRKTAWQYEREKLVFECGEGDLMGNVKECSICKENLNLDGIPVCRICGKGYHRPCILKSGLYTDGELKLVDRCKTQLGWSCTACDNIFNLLTPTELDELSSQFERLDINKDAKISMKEYLSHRKRIHERETGRQITEADEEFEKIQFRYMDADGGGTIEYNEFLKHETCIKLSYRKKPDLKKLLTPREVLQARQVFEKLDEDEDGYVCSADERVAHRSWYSNLLNNLPSDESGEKTQEEVYGTGDIRASIMWDDDEQTDRRYDWQEFLANRAIFIISSRPNKAAAFFIPTD